MIRVKDKLPRTAEELFEILPEGLLCQVISNNLFIAPAPAFQHQDMCDEITSAIRQFIRSNGLGKCVSAPVDVYPDEKNVFQPDIIFIAAENLSIVKKGRVKGVPDLVVEVLSPGRRRHDTITKKAVYERNGVKEYFIVDPATRQVTSFYLQEINLQNSQWLRSCLKMVKYITILPQWLVGHTTIVGATMKFASANFTVANPLVRCLTGQGIDLERI